MDRWIKCMSTQGNIRGVAIQAEALLQEMADKHGLTGAPARSLGEALIGALLVASFTKQGERINLNIQGTGTVRQALVDAYPDGTVRGYVIEGTSGATASTELGPWGTGLLSVLRTKTGDGEKPYIGTVPLLTGHLAKDLTFYWVQSEQIPSAVGLAVNMVDGRIGASGGFLIQVLPGASPEEVRAVEQHINEIGSSASQVAQDGDPMSVLTQIFQDMAFVVVEEKELRFSCNCSWDRVQRALSLVGAEELKAILTADQGATVRCDFCSKEYRADGPTLEKMIEQLESR